MQEVKLKREELLDKVQRNRDNHVEEVREAQEGMLEDIAAYHAEEIARIKAGKSFDTRINFPEPEDHTDDYDQVIAMLEMSVDEEITLSNHEFGQYVMDNWQWKDAHLRTQVMYSKAM